jgi:hypothetical protein
VTKAPAKVLKGVKLDISWRIITDRASGVASCTIEEKHGGGGEDGILEDKGRFEAGDESPATFERTSLTPVALFEVREAILHTLL